MRVHLCVWLGIQDLASTHTDKECQRTLLDAGVIHCNLQALGCRHECLLGEALTFQKVAYVQPAEATVQQRPLLFFRNTLQADTRDISCAVTYHVT